jgi:hypothetical protein
MVKVSVCPQPVSDFCEIKYQITEPCKTRIEVLDLQGRTIMILKESYLSPGDYSERSDLSMLHSGLYFCRITSGDQKGAARIVKY